MKARSKYTGLLRCRFATGGHGDGGFHTHQFSKPDMRWVDVVRKSHPGCAVAYVLDQDTQLESYDGLDVHRIDIDKASVHPMGVLEDVSEITIQCLDAR